MEFKQHERSALKPEYQGKSDDNVIVAQYRGIVVHSWAPEDKLEAVLNELKSKNMIPIRVFKGVAGKYGETMVRVIKVGITPEDYVSKLEAEVLA